MIIYIDPTPPHEQDVTQGHILKRSFTGLNPEYPLYQQKMCWLGFMVYQLLLAI